MHSGPTITIAALSFFGAGWSVNAMSLRQGITPERMRGRVNATMRFVSWSTIPLGTAAGGLLGGVIGLHATIVLGAIGGIVTFVPVAMSPIRAIRTMPEPVTDRSPAPP